MSAINAAYVETMLLFWIEGKLMEKTEYEKRNMKIPEIPPTNRPV